MGLFLLSGGCVFWVSVSVLTQFKTQLIFFRLLSFCLFLISAYGIIEWAFLAGSPQTMKLFSGNSLPAGSLIILLSSGPLIMLSHSQNLRELRIHAIGLALGVTVIFLLGKWGPIISVLAMLTFFSFLKLNNLRLLILTLILLLTTGVFIKNKTLLNLDDPTSKIHSILVRLELYRIGFRIFQEHPLVGIGFYSPLTRYVPEEYKSKFRPYDTDEFFHDVAKYVNTLDNMFLTLWVRTGSLFTLTYAAMIFYILIKPFRRRTKETLKETFTPELMTVFGGFFIHSMTFDSLLFPHLNWLFHSLLGIVGNIRQHPEKGEPKHVEKNQNPAPKPCLTANTFKAESF